jgi:carbonic anhydrase
MQIPGESNTWEVLQFHIHTGTDHAIGGEYHGADLHVVHQEMGSGTRYGVLGFFLEPTSPLDNSVIGDLLMNWEAVEANVNQMCSLSPAGDDTIVEGSPGVSGAVDTRTAAPGNRNLRADERQTQASFNMYNLIPEDASIYTYAGSLTTPPCSEVVFWNVVDTPVKLSVREFLRLTNLILDYTDPATCEFATAAAPSGFTGRPVQAINGRPITRRCPAASRNTESN